MNPEAPSPLDPITKADTDTAQPAPTEAPVAAQAEPVAPAPSAAPAAEPIDATWQSPLKQIRTYQGDVANAIHGEHQSLMSIRTAEKARQDLLKKRETEDAPIEEAEKKSRTTAILLILGSLILIGAAGAAGWYAYTTYLVKTAVPVVEAPKNRFLPVASTKTLDLAKLDSGALATTLAEEHAKPLASGAIEHVELMLTAASSTALATPTELMLYLNARTPGSLVRAFDKLFMLGLIGGEKSDTFLLMKLDSYENAYAGMLAWEQDMRTDILPLFYTPEEMASSTPGEWKDVSIKNKDARELQDTDGKTELIYSFYNQNLLIITASRDALRQLLAELDTQALAR